MKNKNIYVSMTKDGYYALQSLIANNKKIDEIICYPKEYSKNISDYIDFKDFALKKRIKITYTKNINFLINKFSKEIPNIIVVNGWSQFLDDKILRIPKNGCVGTHPALLPKNRGRSPIPWHFINKEKYGGITLFYLNSICDGGPIIDQIKFEIKKTDNASSYYEKITKIGADLLIKHFDSIANGSAKKKAKPQDENLATYLLKRRPKDSWINFYDKTAEEVHNLIRAVSWVYPLANFIYKKCKYYILSSTIPKNHPLFSGIPGQIAKISSEFMWVLTKKGIIQFNSIIDYHRKKIDLLKVFKIGEFLNE